LSLEIRHVGIEEAEGIDLWKKLDAERIVCGAERRQVV
jgi:hypothetical protein